MNEPKINQLFTPYNYTNKNDASRVQYIVIHYVGALGGAEANCSYYAGKYIGASAHYFIGFDGEIWQSVADGDIAWHCGAKNYKHPACRNSNSIGIEMCVRKENTKRLGADDTDWFFEQATVDATLKLIQWMMKKYRIPEGNVLRHYDVTGKCCPNPYVKGESLWKEFKKAIGANTEETGMEKMTKLTGKAQAAAKQMTDYLRAKNSNVPQNVLEMIPLYIEEGEIENIRGDIAFAQSCLETGNFTFKGSAVSLSQNNFCGLGVTKKGEKGNSFDLPNLGIRAQIQHLKAYANTSKLKNECVDPRFRYVVRGCAPYVEYLGIQENPKGKGWAAGAGYGSKILQILDAVKGIAIEQQEETEDVPVAEQTPPLDQGYRIVTTCDVLNIRAGAGIVYPVVGNISETAVKKQYTIVEEAKGWGKLKSGAGWIRLSYTKRVS